LESPVPFVLAFNNALIGLLLFLVDSANCSDFNFCLFIRLFYYLENDVLLMIAALKQSIVKDLIFVAYL
jgi:hypothetical protein